MGAAKSLAEEEDAQEEDPRHLAPLKASLESSNLWRSLLPWSMPPWFSKSAGPLLAEAFEAALEILRLLPVPGIAHEPEAAGRSQTPVWPRQTAVWRFKPRSGPPDCDRRRGTADPWRQAVFWRAPVMGRAGRPWPFPTRSWPDGVRPWPHGVGPGFSGGGPGRRAPTRGWRRAAGAAWPEARVWAAAALGRRLPPTEGDAAAMVGRFGTMAG